MSLKISRRTLVKGSVVAGAAAVITSKKSAVFAQSTTGASPPPIAPPVMCTDEPTNSPATTPFVDDLPIPLPATPTFLFPAPTKSANTAQDEAARDDHQAWDAWRPRIFYHNIAAPSLH